MEIEGTVYPDEDNRIRSRNADETKNVEYNLNVTPDATQFPDWLIDWWSNVLVVRVC